MTTYSTPTQADVDYIVENLRQEDRDDIYSTRYNDSADDYKGDLFRRCGFAYCIKRDDEPVAVIGASPIWPGVWIAFLLATDKFESVKFTTFKVAKKIIIPTLQEDMDAHLIYTYANPKRTKALHFLQRFGGVVEHNFREFGKNREDYLIVCLRKESA